MASGRGRMLRGCCGLQAQRGSLHGGGATWGSAGQAAGRSGFSFRVKFVRGSSVLKQYARRDQYREKPSFSSSSISSIYLDRMPSEILVKILSYLDAVTLVCIGCVSRRFYHLASDNLIWVRKYAAAFTSKRLHWKATSVEETARSVSLLSVCDKEDGYWKKEYITKQISSVKANLTHILSSVNTRTGLPLKTKESLRISGLGWTIILREASGKEHMMQHSDLSVNDNSVTVFWHDKNWPHVDTLSTLDLYGSTPIFMEQYKGPNTSCPRWLSLIEKYDLSNLSKSTMIGCDRHVRVFCVNPGLLVGLWQENGGLAFVMANIHSHGLVERSTMGSDTIPYTLSPNNTTFVHVCPDQLTLYGQRAFQLHIDIHGSKTYFLCSTFYNLFCRRAVINNGYVNFLMINLKNNREHLPLVGKVGLEWRTDSLNGLIEIIKVPKQQQSIPRTIHPYNHFGALIIISNIYQFNVVCLRSACLSDFPQPAYSFEYMDNVGRVCADLGWFENTDEYFIVRLEIYLSVTKIPQWFGRQ
ncbi:F-box only protein 15 [Mus caroli]|uniref:F-box only protein 15 n=1 Tax=Mus caroli TaxID=10089 RepID=A0A6P7QF46_MUSCR|nr:F-box only protein 15 [Mus caroli]